MRFLPLYMGLYTYLGRSGKGPLKLADQPMILGFQLLVGTVPEIIGNSQGYTVLQICLRLCCEARLRKGR